MGVSIGVVSMFSSMTASSIGPSVHGLPQFTTGMGRWEAQDREVIPRIGRHRLDRLRPEHLDQLYTALLDDGYSPASVLRHHRILSRALTVAVQRGHRSEEHTSELQSRQYLVCRLLLEKKKNHQPCQSHIG